MLERDFNPPSAERDPTRPPPGASPPAGRTPYLHDMQRFGGNQAMTRMLTGGGRPLDGSTRSSMESRFGESLEGVRLHPGAQRLTAEAGAEAVTVGQDIFFRSAAYSPALLAHEVTHAVQNAKFGSGSRGVSSPHDDAEREARTAASSAGPIPVRSAPAAAASRGVLGWIEETASDAWEGVSDTASAAGEMAGDAAGAVGEFASDAWDVAGQAGSSVYGAMKTGSKWVKSAEHAFGRGIDWVQEKEKAATGWLVEQADGTILEDVARAGAAYTDFTTEVAGGALRGAGGLVGGLAGMVVNPVDTARGLTAMAEHLPTIPGVPNPVKAIHGLIDVATGEKTWGEFTHGLRPDVAAEQDAEFWTAVGKGFIEPYKEQWDKGKYGDVAGRVGFDVLSMLIGAGEANAAGKLGTAARLGEAGDVAKLAEVADVAKAADLAKAAEVADVAKAADLAKAAEVADVAKVADVTQIAKAADAGDLAKASEAADVAKAAEVTGMKAETLTQVTDELSDFSKAELDAWAAGFDEGKASSNTMFEMPGQNPKTGHGLQDIRIREDPGAGKINYHVNHNLSDTNVTSISESVAGTATTPAKTPKTTLTNAADDSAVLNEAGKPIGERNAEVRYHSTDPAFPDNGPTVQVNTPSKKYGWREDPVPGQDPAVKVKGMHGRYLLPDGTWKRIKDMTPEEKASVHWPAGGD